MLMSRRNVFTCPACDYCVPDYRGRRSTTPGGRKALRRNVKRTERQVWKKSLRTEW